MGGWLKAIAASVILSIAFTVGYSVLFSFTDEVNIVISEVENEIYEQINLERANIGLPTLTKDVALTSIAVNWSQKLAEKGELTHGDFDERIHSIAYPRHQCSEIIAMYPSSAFNLGRIFVDLWLDSPGHREAMITPLYGYMGVGVTEGPEGYYAVVDFRFL